MSAWGPYVLSPLKPSLTFPSLMPSPPTPSRPLHFPSLPYALFCSLLSRPRLLLTHSLRLFFLYSPLPSSLLSLFILAFLISPSPFLNASFPYTYLDFPSLLHLSLSPLFCPFISSNLSFPSFAITLSIISCVSLSFSLLSYCFSYYLVSFPMIHYIHTFLYINSGGMESSCYLSDSMLSVCLLCVCAFFLGRSCQCINILLFIGPSIPIIFVFIFHFVHLPAISSLCYFPASHNYHLSIYSFYVTNATFLIIYYPMLSSSSSLSIHPSL